MIDLQVDDSSDSRIWFGSDRQLLFYQWLPKTTLIIIIIIIINNNNLVWCNVMWYILKSASHVSSTNQPHPFLQGAFHAPDKASSTRPKAQARPRFNRLALDGQQCQRILRLSSTHARCGELNLNCLWITWAERVYKRDVPKFMKLLRFYKIVRRTAPP